MMSEFYRLRKDRPRLTKAAALQLAQRELITGNFGSSTMTGAKRDTTEIVGADARRSAFITDSKRPYAHPYYWSPFILIGNWR
jgi:CHAT domain-containing protein